MIAHSDILKIASDKEFNSLAMQLFKYQYHHVDVYKQFCDAVNRTPSDVNDINQIPFLPVSLFKSYDVIQNRITDYDTVFYSSGTSGQLKSKHIVADSDWYKKVSLTCFELFFGPISSYRFIAFLPSYLEQDHSSLVFMVKYFMSLYPSNKSLFTRSVEETKLALSKASPHTTILLGVSYALLDLAEANIKFPYNIIVMETGGMKGRRKEMIRTEFHQTLEKAFNVGGISSEYGMTELLSQAYSRMNGIFKCPPWMKVLIRNINDPFHYVDHGRSGTINIIDLANVHSCAFISTEDLGRSYIDGTFEVLGRSDHSEIRGCNLMYEF